MRAAEGAAKADRRRTRRVLLIMAAIALAPIVGSTLAYYYFPRAAQTNYGKLLAVPLAADIAGVGADGAPFRMSQLQGRWVLVVAAPGACDTACERELYATRQARTMQGKALDRVVRVWLVTDAVAPRESVTAEHPGIVIAHAGHDALAILPAGERAIYVIDPRGNLVLQYPEDPDIRGLAKDLTRLLQASSIG